MVSFHEIGTANYSPEFKIQLQGVTSAPIDSDFSRGCWTQLGKDSILRPELPWETNCIEAAALCKHNGKLYSFSGVSTTFGEFAKVIGDTIGKPITYVEITLEQAEAGMKSRNMPDWLVAHLVSIARAGGKGAFSHENTQPIRDIIGRAPITTKQFAQDFKGAFS